MSLYIDEVTSATSVPPVDHRTHQNNSGGSEAREVISYIYWSIVSA
ncbi:MAG TPA: hypothetical protein VE076_08280 [Nitrososphaeraceae archaeon]|nr:hypothetical protein [Nitrososphaeraceae archaeon]